MPEPTAKKTTKKATKKTTKPSALVARQSFLGPWGMVTKGTVVRPDDPIVKDREHLFDKAEDTYRNRAG